MSTKEGEKPATRQWTHYGERLRCDVCRKRFGKTGIQWHCTECHDYDLCDECDKKGEFNQLHTADHPMIRIKDGHRGSNTILTCWFQLFISSLVGPMNAAVWEILKEVDCKVEVDDLAPDKPANSNAKTNEI